MSDIVIQVQSPADEFGVTQDVIEVIVQGGVGPQGPPGADGTGSGGGGADTFVFSQQVASNHWIIDHTWPGGFPSVSVVDTSGNIMLGRVVYASPTRVEIFFSPAISGYAYLN